MELVDFLEYGFPVGVDPDDPTKPSLKNHSSSYMYYTYLDKFCVKEVSKAGMTGPLKCPLPLLSDLPNDDQLQEAGW